MTKKIETVLDLPIKRQKELADLMGMSHSEWVEDTKRSLKETEEFVKDITSKGSDLNSHEIAHMQSKMDSGNPP